MKQIKQMILYGLANLVATGLIVGGGIALRSQGEQIRKLEDQLSIAITKTDDAKKDLAGYRNQLIQHGNPEGWQLTADNLTGEPHYIRWNGDAIGNAWQETLPYTGAR